MPVWRLQVRDQHDRAHDVFVDAEGSTATSTLSTELDEAGFRSHPHGANGMSLSAVGSIGELQLAHGDTITCGRLERPSSRPGPGRNLVVVCGPDAGVFVQLPADGSVVIGRSPDADLTLDDQLLSARHCRIDIESSRITVVDLGSTNGTYMEGVELTQPIELHSRSYVHIGSSVLTVVDIHPSDLAVVGEPDGPDRVFQRQYRVAQHKFPRKIDPPKPPRDDDSASQSMWWRALLPVVTGVGMAVITKRWIFLAIVVAAPIVMGVDAYRRKTRRTKKQVQDQERYDRELATFRAQVTELRTQERDRRRDASHCGGVALLLSSSWHRRLWERAASDEDFVAVPVGLGPVASEIEAEDPEGALDAVQWGTPIETNLLGTGSLSIVGEIKRARAAARGIVMNLMATHSPADLRLWILTRDEDGDDWGFARWLPHTFNGPNSSLIAGGESERATLLKALKQTVDTRAELDAKEVPLPVNVVFIDGTDLLDPGELTDLLRRGPELGVVAVTIDARLSPEGVGATLNLGDAADLAIFDSRHHPRTEGIIVPEIDTAAAEHAARRMAALRPSTDDQGGGIGGVCHLVEIERLVGITAEQVVERWSKLSPHMVATVGLSSETPMYVDLIKDGPHGLIGGTSGSGKTEFLKTMFMSLCLNNHPDDLSIVIVDFKGGVDHDAVRPLPHVVDVATNLDIEQFQRTIAMLNAEQKRRQGLLNEAGANNVVSYRSARKSKPWLPPLPRLLVVVDEFSELLASDGGREQLKQLESVTRIGRALGLHLLLVTQNFEGNLPTQIEANAGLRISLRVQKPSHSKAVLDSGVAASIPDKRVGRAYARFQGRDLIEFQTARVAGRRRDLEPQSAGATVRPVPFSALANVPPERRSEDVPNEDTDMYLLVERTREAAAATGWTESAVPWPSSLPTGVSVLRLAQLHDGQGVPIGLLDVPEQQRRATAALTDPEQQVAIIGGPSAPVAEVLTSYGASLAMMSSPDDTHLYGIDLLGRGLSQLTDLPHCGGIAVRNEQLALRIVRWMLKTSAERKIEMASTGSSNIWDHASITGRLPPRIVLLVSGVDRILSVTEGTVSHLLPQLTTLMSEGLGVRFQVVLAGLPRVVLHRIGMNIERRIIMQLADANEYGPIGATKAVASQLRTERRAVLLPDKKIMQLGQLAPAGQAEGAVIRSLAESLPTPVTCPPHRFADIVWPMPWEQAARTERRPPAQFISPVPIALDTNTGDWSWIDALDDGPVFAVAGPPKSGRSTALAVIAALAAEQGWNVVNATTSRRSPLSTSSEQVLANRCDPYQLGEVMEACTGRVVRADRRLAAAGGQRGHRGGVEAPRTAVAGRRQLTRFLLRSIRRDAQPAADLCRSTAGADGDARWWGDRPAADPDGVDHRPPPGAGDHGRLR